MQIESATAVLPSILSSKDDGFDGPSQKGLDVIVQITCFGQDKVGFG